MKAMLRARMFDRLTELMEDLILTDDDRVAAGRDGDRMTDCRLADEAAAARRQP